MFDIAFKIWGLGIFVVVLVQFWALGQFMASLRYRHPAVWRRLGQPTPLGQPSQPGALFRLQGYIARAEYEELQDPKMQLYGDIQRYWLVALFLWVAVGIVFVEFPQNGGPAGPSRPACESPRPLNSTLESSVSACESGRPEHQG